MMEENQKWHKFVGKWEESETEGLFQFLQAIGEQAIEAIKHCVEAKNAGQSEGMRKTVNIEVSDEGKHWKVAIDTPHNKRVDEFDIGVEYDKDSWLCGKVKCLNLFEDGKLIEIQKQLGNTNKSGKFIFSIDPNNDMLVIDMIIEPDNVKAVRKFKRI